jgi:capsular polysaccharide biosynthesis protein
MTTARVLRVLSRYWTTVMWFVIIGLILGVALSFIRPLEYRASSRLLITQESVSADAYTASRSAERVADDLATIVFTTAFFDQVLSAQFNIDQSQFPSDEGKEAKRRKVWRKMLATSVERGTGLLSIDAYNKDPEQARQVSQAIAFVLTQQGWRYTSGGNISVRLVDDPIVSKYPVRPNIPTNAFIGLILGGLIGGAYVLARSESMIRRKKFMH